jgi:hypothetical protein
VEESRNIEHKNEKRTLKEYARRLRLIMNVQLSAKSEMQETGTLTKPVIRYSIGIIDWHQK